ncbi:hypothetical protein BCR34DRAFT_598919 [Clohesyomyces aquaticus]|uniref:Uncharacterized protein n=1 Tax=Clohesyomyces aquaticus TaxID=1231657 RepID=A0A1Y1ZX21_9PLEO|nr:hypothetical protein BCR34DRAFT_598919 [Clohesyomyces aquaticus]
MSLLFIEVAEMTAERATAHINDLETLDVLSSRHLPSPPTPLLNCLLPSIKLSVNWKTRR